VENIQLAQALETKVFMTLLTTAVNLYQLLRKSTKSVRSPHPLRVQTLSLPSNLAFPLRDRSTALFVPDVVVVVFFWYMALDRKCQYPSGSWVPFQVLQIQKW